MKPLAGCAVAAYVGLAIVVSIDAVSMWHNVAAIRFLAAIKRGGPIDLERAQEMDAFAAVMEYVALAALLAAAAAFCLWFHRAHANLRAAGLPRMKYGSGWAIGGFFVPVLNLVRPYHVMCEVWAGTTYLAGIARVRSWEIATPSPLIGRWWELFLAATALAYLSVIAERIGMAWSATQGAWVSILSCVLHIGAALAAVTIVRRVTELQDRAAEAADEPV